jgi:hypothetical protein
VKIIGVTLLSLFLSVSNAADEGCPYPKTYITIDQFFHECNSGRYDSCDYFLDEITPLFSRYDCKRIHDTHPVPAIWLFGAAMDDYLKLLYQLSSGTDKYFGSDSLSLARYRAKVIFTSDAFRSVLDGYYAEEYFPLIENVKKKDPYKG